MHTPIDCKDQLPPYNVEVLVWHSDWKRWLIAFRRATDAKGERWETNSHGSDYRISHWMNMPPKVVVEQPKRKRKGI